MNPRLTPPLFATLFAAAAVFTASVVAAEPLPLVRVESEPAATPPAVRLLLADPLQTQWETDDGRRLRLPAGTILAWGRAPPPPVGPQLALVDGSLLAGEPLQWRPERVTVATPTLGMIEIPAAMVAGWSRHGPVAAAATTIPPRRDGFAAGAGEATGLRLVLANGDRLGGRVAKADDEPGLRLETRLTRAAGPVVNLPFSRIITIDAARAARLPAGRWLVGLADGSRLVATAIEAVDGGYTIEAGFGNDRPPRLRCPSGAVTGLIAVGGRVLPLAILEPASPASFEQSESPGSPWPATRGRSLVGGENRLRGEPAFTGLGLHSAARIGFSLPQPATRLLSRVGIDDTAGQGGSVVVRVRVAAAAGEPLREVFASDVLRGDDDPLALDVDLGGAGFVELAVEPTADGTTLDRSLWLDPRVVLAAEE
jgi:hypothetical protein